MINPRTPCFFQIEFVETFTFENNCKIKQNIETPLALEDDVHKGIALALHGRKHDLIRQQVESKFKLLP